MTINLGFWPSLILFGIAGWCLGWLIDKARIILRNHLPYGEPIYHKVSYPFRVYRHYVHLLIPDFFYKLWYRTGMMDTEAYREAQEIGYISDDLDPEYLQRYENHD